MLLRSTIHGGQMSGALSVRADATWASLLARARGSASKKKPFKESHMAHGSDLPVPELPTPITTPDPVESDPSQLPVEPELDPASPTKPLSVAGFLMAKTIVGGTRLLHTATALRFRANRQFMRAASFRWPDAKASMSRI
jgi:hypothetical protein